MQTDSFTTSGPALTTLKGLNGACLDSCTHGQRAPLALLKTRIRQQRHGLL
jgi:hypothetical protein